MQHRRGGTATEAKDMNITQESRELFQMMDYTRDLYK